jgi:hypothetical protein
VPTVNALFWLVNPWFVSAVDASFLKYILCQDLMLQSDTVNSRFMSAVLDLFSDLVYCIDLLSLCTLCFLPLCGPLLYLLCCVYSDHSASGQYKLTVLFCVTLVWYVSTWPDITPQETPNAGPNRPNDRRRLVVCLLCEPTLLHQALSRPRARPRGLTNTPSRRIAHSCQNHSASTISTFPYFAVFTCVQVTWSLRTV